MKPSFAYALVCASTLCVLSSAGCDQIADTAGNPTPTPAPEDPWSAETYSRALRVVSQRLRGTLPPQADVENVLANGRPAYLEIVDRWLDPALNPKLDEQMRAFYRGVFLMGGTEQDDAPANLATHLFRGNKSWDEMLTADYCVDGTLTPVPCDNAPVGELAGAITTRGFLTTYGQPDTLNFRRMSVVHQVFNCGIYIDPQDGPTKWVRSNVPQEEWPCNAGTDGIQQAGAGCACAIHPSQNQPCAGDDYLDPSLIPSIDDPADRRVSKKYQGYQLGLGDACQACHGSLLPRRLVFTPWDELGSWDPARTLGDVETPEQNGGGDYCGNLTPGNPADDVDPLSAECLPGAKGEYLGVEVSNLRELGSEITKHDRFTECAVTRHYNFALGKSQGSLGMQAGSGVVPPAPLSQIRTKYRLVFESNGRSSRELLRAIFKGNEFLSAQTVPE
jgi:hypothetical protein